MDEFIKVFLDLLKPPWNYPVGIVAFVLVFGPRLMEFRSSWLELRWGRQELEREKLRLEVLKLRIDLRQLAEQEQHKLPEIARELEGVTVSPPSVVVPSPPPPPPERARVLVRFFAGHPRVGWFVMLIAEIFLGFYAISFAVGAVLFPIVGWNDPEMKMGVGGSITAAIVYAALAWLSWKGFSVTRSIRKELAAR
jgi:hypothetical protein